MIRRILYAIIFGLTLYFVIRNFNELKLIIETMSRADGRWLLLAIVVQFIWLVAVAANLQACYRLMGIDEALTRMVPLTAAGNFINVIAPSYGAGAMAVFIADGQRRGKPAGKVSTASFLYLVYDYAGFMIVLALGFTVLIQRGLMTPVLIGAAVFAVTIAVSVISLTTIGILSVDRLARVLVWLTDLANRILRPVIKRKLLDRVKSERFGHEIAEGLREIRRSPRSLIIPGIYALLRKAVMALILFMVSLAFHTPFDAGTLIASFCVSYLFTIASVTPSGVGFVEGAMGLAQTALGIDPATSVGIALTYRGLTFWLVLLYGFFAIRLVGYKPNEAKQLEAEAEFSVLQAETDQLPASNPAVKTAVNAAAPDPGNPGIKDPSRHET
jgi:uncharacterized protein (TIRG00374 family)